MVNTKLPELAETKSQTLPAASLESLKLMREEQCSRASQDFKLQPVQRFLRRVLSPDSPTRSLLMVHGTGAGKTCSAIQIAEEYIIRPEFQDKQVLVLANPSIQENFKSQIFDVSRVDPDGAVLSQQCTGRRYLEMLERSSDESLRYTDRASRNRLAARASHIISEFYEFFGYDGFANMVDNETAKRSSAELNKWIHDTFDNRLIIVDEAHNLRETTETTASKNIGRVMERILQTANGITLVLLTATPMYDEYDEIVYYFNLFLWNEKRIQANKAIKPSDLFADTGGFKEGKEQEFRRLCQDYVSFIKGENPFTFPFRLPPPENITAEIDREKDVDGNPIKAHRKFLKLVKSFVHPNQERELKKLSSSSRGMSEGAATVCVYPEGKSFRETFDKTGEQYSYKGDKFLAPSKVALYSSKFGLITRILKESDGIVFVFSNLVESGAQLFAMCLEEHGYDSALGRPLLKNAAEEIKRGSKGRYVLFTSDTSESDIRRSLDRLRNKANIDGSDIRVVIASPKVSEGVDFRYVRQIHVLDPWYNMSRIEQVLGRGMRTCSHSLLPFEEQNCTIYLHICRYPKGKQETYDEYVYRNFIEEKAQKIAKVKRVVIESAMDCELQLSVNSLPDDWRREKVPQIRAQDKKELKLSLADMFAPTFEEKISGIVCQLDPSEPDLKHGRPLSSILDVRDEVFDKLIKMFKQKPIWSLKDLVKQPALKEYDPSVVLYLIQNAIDTPLKIGDGTLESKGDFVAYSTGENQTMLERVLKVPEYKDVEMSEVVYDEEDTSIPSLDAKRDELPLYVKTFSTEVQDWYIVDALLTNQEKIKVLLSGKWDQPYSKPLKTGDIYVLGLNKIFDSDLKPVVPVGEQLDQYKQWRRVLEDRFIARKSEIFASMKDDKIIFNLSPKSNEVEVIGRTKTIGGQACTSFKEETLNSFAKWLNGKEFPAEAKGKKDRCIYLNFLIREAVLAGKQGLYWITPEEFEVLNEKGNKELREKLQV
jgi:Type III restriction enzyme, res subunit/Helicase conserved C-terminal domain